jgi:hypothetical protein
VELDFPHGNILEPDAKRHGITEGDMEDEVADRNKQNILSLRGRVFAIDIGDGPIEQFTDRCNLHPTDAGYFNIDLTYKMGYNFLFSFFRLWKTGITRY